MLKKIVDLFKIFIYGTNDNVKSPLLAKKKHSKQYKPNKPKSILSSKLNSSSKEGSISFKAKMKNFFTSKPSSEKKLFHKWLKRNKNISKDPIEQKRQWNEYCERRKRIVKFEDESFIEHH